MNDLLEILLRECSARAPEPWYASDYATATGTGRAAIDADLDRLRLGGLVRLTDWVPGKGQGYTVTPEGKELLGNPRLVQRLRANGVEVKPATPPLRAVEHQPTTWDRGEAIRDAFLNPTRPRVTFLLLGLNIIVFLASTYVESNKELPGLKTLLDRAPVSRTAVVVGGEWWRLITYAFLHANLMHIFLNMYFLYSVGPIVETLWGSWRFFILYFGSVLGGAAGVVLAHNGNTVGASGALCGLLASMGTWVLLNRPYLPADLTSRWMRNLTINVFLLVIISMLPGVSAMCHLGGGVAGAVIAVPLVYNRYGRGLERWLGLAGVIAVPLVCLASMSWSITDDERALAIWSETRMAVRVAYNEHALPLLKKEQDTLFDDPQSVREAIAAFEKARKDLQPLAAALARLSPATEPAKKALENTSDLINSWSGFFEAFQAVLERRVPWTEKKQAELQRMGNRLVDRSNHP